MSSVIASLSRHTLRQLKFILPGGLVTFYLDSHNEFLRVYHEEGGLAGTLALLSLALSAATVSLFLYILAFPLIRGEEPNYRHWRQSGVLSTVIPILTTSILLGWSVLAYVLGRWSSLGYLWGFVGASGIYALSFGLLGLIPAPKVFETYAVWILSCLVENHDEKRGLFPMFKSGFLTGSADKVSRRRDDLKRPSCNPDMVHTIIVQTSM